MVVLAPHGEIAKKIPLVRLVTHKLIVSVDAVVGVELLASILADKHTATVHCNRHYRGEPSLSLVLCPPTQIPSSNNMISITNLPSTAAGPPADEHPSSCAP